MRDGQLDFLGPPRSIGEGLANVLRLEIGIELQNLILCPTGGDEPDDGSYRYAEPTQAGLSAHDIGIPRDAIEHLHHSDYRTARVRVEVPRKG